MWEVCKDDFYVDFLQTLVLFKQEFFSLWIITQIKPLNRDNKLGLQM